jgi:hypothetical protein
MVHRCETLLIMYGDICKGCAIVEEGTVTYIET